MGIQRFDGSLVHYREVMGQVNARQAQAMRPNEGPGDDDDDAFLLSSVRAKVMAVNVEGLGRTKDDIVMDSVKDLFKVKSSCITWDWDYFRILLTFWSGWGFWKPSTDCPGGSWQAAGLKTPPQYLKSKFHARHIWKKYFKDLGCFSDVGIHIDTLDSGDKDYQVTFKVCSLWSVKLNF